MQASSLASFIAVHPWVNAFGPLVTAFLIAFLLWSVIGQRRKWSGAPFFLLGWLLFRFGIAMFLWSSAEDLATTGGTHAGPAWSALAGGNFCAARNDVALWKPAGGPCAEHPAAVANLKALLSNMQQQSSDIQNSINALNPANNGPPPSPESPALLAPPPGLLAPSDSEVPPSKPGG